MLILLGKTYLERFYQDLANDVLVGMSDTTYINNELAYQYIMHFNRQLKKIQCGAHRILLCDGCSSYITKKVIDFCNKNLIYMFVLPPHTSYIL
jgi:hypothetical protein